MYHITQSYNIFVLYDIICKYNDNPIKHDIYTIFIKILYDFYTIINMIQLIYINIIYTLTYIYDIYYIQLIYQLCNIIYINNVYLIYVI